MECTNLHILITIIVIMAGIVLVTLLYVLNFTITIGAINGIIFYANIVSINDSVFFVNDSVFKPLRVFIKKSGSKSRPRKVEITSAHKKTRRLS